MKNYGGLYGAGLFSVLCCREFYYERKDLFRSQRQVDEIARNVSELLQRPPWHLCLTTTSKGLIAGDLVLVTSDGNRLNCDAEPTGDHPRKFVKKGEIITSLVTPFDSKRDQVQGTKLTEGYSSLARAKPDAAYFAVAVAATAERTGVEARNRAHNPTCVHLIFFNLTNAVVRR